jgi:DNA-binding transcriptional MerR regulator
MSRGKGLLSIGDVSKLSGVGIKALRYYDKIKILEPSYVDPDSSYRYYTYNQMYLLEIIMFCVELDIPLSELNNFIDKDKSVDYSRLLAYEKKVAEEKLKKIKKGLRFINGIEQKIAITSKYPKGKQIYTREVTEKKFHVIPYEQTFKSLNDYDVAKLLLDVPFSEDDEEWREYGFMCEVSPLGVQRYVFLEIPMDLDEGNCKIISSGIYHCRQSDESQIEKAAVIFNDYIAGKDSYIVIETDVFSGKFNIDKPMNEVRVLIN